MGGRVQAVSEQGEIIDLSDAFSMQPLVPKSVGNVQKMDVFESRMALVTNSAVLFFDIRDSLFPLGSLSRNIHYVQRTEVPEPLWLDDRRFALASWTGWASWISSVCCNRPNPSFRKYSWPKASSKQGRYPR